jgi:hypothetical protein
MRYIKVPVTPALLESELVRDISSLPRVSVDTAEKEFLSNTASWNITAAKPKMAYPPQKCASVAAALHGLATQTRDKSGATIQCKGLQLQEIRGGLFVYLDRSRQDGFEYFFPFVIYSLSNSYLSYWWAGMA